MCVYSQKCWRFWYTKYLQIFKDYPGGNPPARSSLIFSINLPTEMSRTSQKKDGSVKYPGIYAEVMPLPSNNNTWCPYLLDRSFDSCHEYIKEQNKEHRRANRKRKYLERFPEKKQRVNIDKEVKKSVWRKCKFNCYYCDRNYHTLKALSIEMQIDHFTPRALGGSQDESNLVLSCQECNRAKGTEIWSKGERIGYYS